MTEHKFKYGLRALWGSPGIALKINLLVGAVTLVVFSIGFIWVSLLGETKNSLLVILALVLTALLLVFLSSFLQRTIFRPLLDLGVVVKNISRGDLSSRAKVHSMDEIGQLAGTLNMLAEKLKVARSTQERDLKIQKDVNEMKDDFVAMVGHELRTPLATVIGLSNAMLEGYVGKISPKQQDMLQQIQDKGEHLVLVINNILDLEQIQSGSVKLDPHLCSLKKIVNDAVLMVEGLCGKKGVELANHFDLNLPSMMLDRIKVQSVITNLLENALKHTPSGGKIEISAAKLNLEPDSTHVEILVSDTGSGIPPEEREKIFDRFYQIQNASGVNFSGVGLGLPLARAFARAHRGWLTVVDQPDWSTTLSLVLPIREKMEAPITGIRKSLCHVPSLLQGIVRMLEEEHGEKRELKVTLPSDEEINEFETDKELLRNVLINRIQSALRFRNHSGWNTLHCGYR